MNELLSNRFQIDSLIGEGNFGSVYKAQDTSTGLNVAIKIEKPCKISQIDTEVEVLESLSHEKGFPRLIYHGQHKNQKYLAMTLLGHNLQRKMILMRKMITLDAVIDIGFQCFQRIKSLHDHFFIHRDLKPQQFLIDYDSNVSLVDFGLCKKYLNKKMMIHIPFTDSRPFVGTINYASLNTHNGIQQSRRDDLESFCYILSYLIKGKLPWISSRKKFSEKEIKKMKTGLAPSLLFKNLNLIQFFIHVKSLQFEKTPDYTYLFSLITKAIEEEKMKSSSKEIPNEISVCSTKSKTKVRRHRKKGNKNFKRSNLCKTLENFSISIFDNSGTEVCENMPEIKDRRILEVKFVGQVEKYIEKNEYNCCIV